MAETTEAVAKELLHHFDQWERNGIARNYGSLMQAAFGAATALATLTAENARLQAEVEAMRRTEHQIVAQTEELARMMLSEIGTGYAVPADFVFHTSEIPRAIKAWQLACLAQEHLTGTDPNDAVANLDGEYDALAT